MIYMNEDVTAEAISLYVNQNNYKSRLRLKLAECFA